MKPSSTSIRLLATIFLCGGIGYRQSSILSSNALLNNPRIVSPSRSGRIPIPNQHVSLVRNSKNSFQKRNQITQKPPSSTTTSLQAVGALPGAARSLTSLVQAMHGDTTYVLTAILWLSTFGISLEKRTTIGKALSVSNMLSLFTSLYFLNFFILLDLHYLTRLPLQIFIGSSGHNGIGLDGCQSRNYTIFLSYM